MNLLIIKPLLFGCENLINKNKLKLFFVSMAILISSAQAQTINSNFIENCFINETIEGECWKIIFSETEPTVLYDFGVHYANGDGVKQDLTKGRYWIHHAALKGYPLAQYNLGVMFFSGFGGIQSQECAVHWFNKSVVNDDSVGLLAKQALDAISRFNSQSKHTFPRIFRPLNPQECEQLPPVDFPANAEIQLIINDDQPRLYPISHEKINLLFSKGIKKSKDFLSKKKIRQESVPSLAVNPIFSEPTLDVKTVSYLRQKFGRYFIMLEYTLIGQDDKVIAMITNLPTHLPSHIKDNIYVDKKIEDEADKKLISTLKTTDSHENLSSDLTNNVSSNIKIKNEIKNSEDTPYKIKSFIPNPTVDIPHKRDKINTQSKKEDLLLNLGGELRNAPKNHYTLQLSSASQPESLFALAKKQQLTNFLVYETKRHDRRWYILVYGEFANIKQAKKALHQLPVPLKKDTPWVRSLAHVQAEL